MHKRVFLIITVIMAIMAAVSFGIKTDVKVETKNNLANKTTCGKINSKRNIQYIFTPKENIVSFNILVGTYDKILEWGDLFINVYDYNTEKLIGKASVNARGFRDNQYIEAITGKMNVKDKKIIVEITGKGFNRNMNPTLWFGDNGLDEDSQTYIDGVKSKDQLIINTNYTVKETPYTFELILLTAFSFILYCCQTEEKKIEQKDFVKESITDDKL